MGVTYYHLVVKKETFDRMAVVIEEFLKHNPEYRNVNITHDIIVDRVFRYYMGERF